MTICLTEDAYKKVINPATGDKFKDSGCIQVPGLTEETLVEKMGGYKIDREDKKIRVISPIIVDGRVIDIAVVTEINDKVVWDRR